MGGALQPLALCFLHMVEGGIPFLAIWDLALAKIVLSCLQILRGSLGGCFSLKVWTPTAEEFPVLSALINGATHGFQYGCLLGWES